MSFRFQSGLSAGNGSCSNTSSPAHEIFLLSSASSRSPVFMQFLYSVLSRISSSGMHLLQEQIHCDPEAASLLSPESAMIPPDIEPLCTRTGQTSGHASDVHSGKTFTDKTNRAGHLFLLHSDIHSRPSQSQGGYEGQYSAGFLSVPDPV